MVSTDQLEEQQVTAVLGGLNVEVRTSDDRAGRDLVSYLGAFYPLQLRASLMSSGCCNEEFVEGFGGGFVVEGVAGAGVECGASWFVAGP